MDHSSISSIVAFLAAISIASERLVEIIKGYVPALSVASSEPAKEGRRKAAIQLLAMVSGIATVFMAGPALPVGIIPDSWLFKIVLGLIASGGSGFWNSIQGYVSQTKELKKVQAEEKKIEIEEKKDILEQQLPPS